MSSSKKVENIRTVFTANLKVLMARFGATQEMIANDLGITQPAVSNYLRGSIPRMNTLSDLANYFGVSVHDLLGADLSKDDSAVSSSNPQKTGAKAWKARLKAIARGPERKVTGGSKFSRAKLKFSTKDFEDGHVSVPVSYKSALSGKALPGLVEVSMLDSIESMRLFSQLRAGKGLTEFLILSLPLEYRKQVFLNLLTLDSIVMIARVAFVLTYGEDVAEELMDGFGFQ